MNRRAAAAALVLLLALLALPAASAGCTTQGGPAGFQICDDHNGNGVPDRVKVWTPVADAEHDEHGCNGCPSETEAQVKANPVRAGAEVRCALGGEIDDLGCPQGEVEVRAQSLIVAIWFFETKGNGPDHGNPGDGGPSQTWVCIKVGATGNGIALCKIVHDG